MREECFRTLLQAVPSLTFEADAGGNNTFVSDQWCVYTGLTPEESAGWGWAQALHPDEAEAVKARWAESVRAGTPFESKQRLRAADGAYRWFIARILPVCDGQAKIIRWAGSLTDIDDLVRTEETLRASEEFNRRLFASSNDCIKVLDLEGNLLSMNDRGLHFAVDIDANTGFWIEADAARLQQVFWNLLKNAIKFTPPGGCVGVRVLGLPDRSGVELVRELRSRGQRLPAIALSGYGQEEDVNRSREAGFNAHLTKPVDFEHFYRVIADMAQCPAEP